MATDDDILGLVTPEDGYIEVYECDEYEVRGYIVPIDGKVRPNIPVKIKEESNIYSSTSTNNNGYFSTSFYFPGSGTYTPQVVCGRLSEYVTGSYNTYISVLPCSINLTSTKDILSYADNDTTTITATLICDDDNTAILSDREITFNVRKQSDSSIIQTTTKTTNATGEASFEYESQGIGDIYIEALCGVSVSKTFALQDCWKYDGTEHTETFSSSSANSILYDVGTSDCIVELDVQTDGYNYLCGLGHFNQSNTLTEHISYGATSNGGTKWISSQSSSEGAKLTSYYSLKWVRTSNNMKLYLNGSVIIDTTQSMVTTLNKLLISNWNSKTIKYKNLKVKPL